MSQELAKKKRLLQENLATAEKYILEKKFEEAALKARHALEIIVNTYVERYAPEDVFLNTFEKINSLKKKEIITEATVNTLHGVRKVVNKGGAHFDENGVDAEKIKALVPPLKKEAELLWTVLEQSKSNYSNFNNYYGQKSQYESTGSSAYRSTSSNSYGSTGNSTYRSAGNNSYSSTRNYSSFANTGYSSYKGASNSASENVNSSSYRNTGSSSYGNTESSTYRGNNYTSNTVGKSEDATTKTVDYVTSSDNDLKQYYRARDNIYVGLSLVTLFFAIAVHIIVAFQYEFLFKYFEDRFEYLATVITSFFAIVGWRGAVQRYIENNKIFNKLPKSTMDFVAKCLLEGFFRSVIQSVVYIGLFIVIVYGCTEKLELEIPLGVSVWAIMYAVFISFVRCYGKLIKRIFSR